MDFSKGKPEKDKTPNSEFFSLFGKGFILGSADVIPGVSGGTMALILGIYKRLLDAIRSVDSTAIKQLFRLRLSSFFESVHWKFGLILFAGIFSALLFFTRVVPLPVFMYTHPELIYGLFFGLILGSVFLLVKDLPNFSPIVFISIGAGTLAGFWVVTLVPTDTPDHPLFLFFTGSLSITALVLPGISGSFILLILRKYDTILGSIGQLGTAQTIDALFILVPFGFGVVFGLAAFARVLSWLLRKYYLPTLCILIGFMAGSLYILWPFQDREFTESYRSQTVAVNSPIASLAENSSPTDRAPDYLILGDIVNPDAPESEQLVEVITVKNKLVSSKPFLPGFNRNVLKKDDRLTDGLKSVIQGFSMLTAGLGIILLIGFLSRKKFIKPESKE
ncbi:MAG: DUF368 domain-containing protein [Balneolales bacterium]|nr:DUF368 domain-containing protein [Balneolales bacterium]